MDKSLLEFTKISFENLNRQIRLADNKAKFILSIDLALISAIFAACFHVIDRYHQQEISHALLTTILIILGINFLIILYSLITTILIIQPQLHKKKLTNKLLYWDNIAEQSIEEAIKNHTESSEEDLVKALISEIHNYSKVTETKYKQVRRALSSLLITIVFSAAVMLLWVGIESL